MSSTQPASEASVLPWAGWRGAAFGLIYLLCAVAFTLLLFRSTTVIPCASMEHMTAMTASRPFQYRVLVPLLAHGLVALNPESPIRELYMVLTTVFVFALLLSYSFYLGRFYPAPVALSGALLLLYPMVWNYCVLGQFFLPYDIPAALFFVLGLCAIDARRHAAYYGIFVLACVNRETACFLTLAFLLWHYRRGAVATLAAHVCAQALIWLAIKAALTWIFRENAGGVVCEWQLLTNIRQIADLNTNGIYVVFAFGLLWLLIPFGWSAVPLWHKRLLWIVPPFFLVMACMGKLWEARIYSELVPIITAAALPAFLSAGMGAAAGPRDARAGRDSG